MSTAVTYKLLNQDLFLLPQKAIFWQQERALIAADVHLGKVGHFRKSGIAVPLNMEQSELGTLSDLIFQYKPQKLILLGDFFHSDMNSDWDWFVLWRSQFPKLEITLVKGNHDIIDFENYRQQDILIVDELRTGPFLMLHHPLTGIDLAEATAYVLCGHIHPGISLSGRARQHLTLPCFAFGDKQAILPSFGTFTGRIAIRSAKTDRIFAIAKDKVVAIE